LRAVHELNDHSADWGIRSHRLRLSDSTFTSSNIPSAFLSPLALTALAPSQPPSMVGPERATALKTWLGYRYDRPAVPEHLVELARDIAKRAQRRGGRTFADGLHDVLMQFDDQTNPPQFDLIAVMCDGTDPEEARLWLTTVGTAVSTKLGVLSGVQVGYRREIPLSVIEDSYAADVTRLSWGDPDGPPSNET
jgi:hypothetical protein